VVGSLAGVVGLELCKRGRLFQNDLNIFYLLQLIVKKYPNSFSIFYAKINRKMIGYFDSKVVLEPTSPFIELFKDVPVY
jgi:hypothetical protein